MKIVDLNVILFASKRSEPGLDPARAGQDAALAGPATRRAVLGCDPRFPAMKRTLVDLSDAIDRPRRVCLGRAIVVPAQRASCHGDGWALAPAPTPAVGMRNRQELDACPSRRGHDDLLRRDAGLVRPRLPAFSGAAVDPNCRARVWTGLGSAETPAKNGAGQCRPEAASFPPDSLPIPLARAPLPSFLVRASARARESR